MEGDSEVSAALIGDIVGRLVISYFVVWVIMWLAVAKGDWRGATRCTRRWYGVVVVAVTFSLGLLTAMSRCPIV